MSGLNHLEQIAHYYDAETNRYDEGYGTLTCDAEDAVVADILKEVIKGKVLDVGSGSGLLYEIMNVDDYVGVELSEQMNREAKRKHPGQPFMVGDMHKLPFPDASFDSAASLYGPPSYSLEPETLLAEITRVVKPGGYVALMPYTLRVGHNLEIGGYSTATEPGIEKIYYTEEMLRELLRSQLEDVEVIGINYFLNTYTRFVQAMNLDADQSVGMFIDFLKKERTFEDLLPAEFARHMIGIGRVPSL